MSTPAFFAMLAQAWLVVLLVVMGWTYIRDPDWRALVRYITAMVAGGAVVGLAGVA